MNIDIEKIERSNKKMHSEEFKLLLIYRTLYIWECRNNDYITIEELSGAFLGIGVKNYIEETVRIIDKIDDFFGIFLSKKYEGDICVGYRLKPDHSILIETEKNRI